MHTKLRLLASALLPAVKSSALVQTLLIFGLVPLNQIFNVAATVGFANSGMAGSATGFIFWQIVGSLFGFGTQITFAGMVRFFSLRIANAVGIGLAFFSAQFFGAHLYFHEPFTPAQWAGTTLLFLGILLIALGR